MELFEAIFNRRSIRRYTKNKIDDNTLTEIVRAGMYAPSAVNKQPWHFIIFRSQEVIHKLMQVHPNASMLLNANAAILICYDQKLEHDNGYGPIDCSAATQNILLAAHGLSLGACWIGIYPREERIQTLHKAFDLPEHVIPFAVISVGYPGEEKSKPERFIKNRIHFEKWEIRD